jgi:Type IV secretion-system coupling protein DNA-binding domain
MKNQWRISVYEPFFARGDKRSADLAETETLYERVRRLHAGFRYADEVAFRAYAFELFAPVEERLPDDLRSSFYAALFVLLRDERVIFDMPEFHPSLSLKEMVELRDALRRKEHFHANEDRFLGLLGDCATAILSHVAGLLPKTVAPSPFTVPLICALPEPAKLIDDLYATLWEDRYVDAGLFVETTRRMYFNLCTASDISDPQEPKRPFKPASKNDAPPVELVETYLHDTAFEFLFNETQVPLAYDPETRFAHTWIIGGTGAGKTQLLQNLILHDLQSDDPPSLVIVDSQGDLIDKVSHLAVFRDRPPILITPKDIDHPPALNIFDINRARIAKYGAIAREQVVAGAIQTFEYMFNGLGIDLTGKQGVCFRNMCRLMLALPRPATILDLLNLTEERMPAEYQSAVGSLPDLTRQFFERDFVGPEFRGTKQQIRSRLQGILENPTIARLFTQPETKIDIFAELNRGSVILVDTAKDFLRTFTPYFGRLFISLVLQAVMERVVVPEAERKATFLVIDEAHEYFDENIDDLLIEARKYKVGCVLAHQFLDQTSTYLRSSLASSTATKLAARLSVSDARFLAPNMRTEPEVLLSAPRLTFVCHIRDATPQAVLIPVEAGKLESEPRITDEEYDSFLDRNRKRVSLGNRGENRERQPHEQSSQPKDQPRGYSERRPEPKPPPPEDVEDDYRL